jgi:hypothetical protein
MSSRLHSKVVEVEGDIGWVLEDFTVFKGPNGGNYIVPDLFAPGLEQMLEVYNRKLELEVEKAGDTVCLISLYFSLFLKQIFPECEIKYAFFRSYW